MRSIVAAAFLIIVCATPAAAQGDLDQWGTFATTIHSDCADLCDPGTDPSWPLGLTFGPTNFGAEFLIVDSTISNAHGDAFAEASILSALSPEVRVDAVSLPGGWVDGAASAVQGFTYLGSVAGTIDVNVQLTGTIGNPDSDPATGLTSQVAYVGNANIASMVFEDAVQGLFSPDGAIELGTTGDGPVNLGGVLSIPVSPGDRFYLIASAAATAGGANAFAGSLATLSVSFDPSDAANLAAAGVPPAVPALNGMSLALLGLALSGAGVLVRARLPG